MIAWLTDTLLMTGAIMALVLLIRRPVGRWFGPGAAYALWALPMIRLLLPPLSLPQSLALMPASDDLMPTAGDAVQAAAAIPVFVEATAAPAIVEPSWAIPWTAILLTIWLGGAAVFLVRRIIGYRLMREELMRDAWTIGRSGTVRIVETDAVAAPVAFGVIDRVVALPAGFLATADSDASDFAVTHELEHHAGNDLLANMAVQPLFALHWFNPLAWLAWRALRSDQEAACDARVMAGRSRQDRERYGRLIASFAAGSRFALAAPMAGPLRGEKPIIHRLKALVRNEVPERHRILGRSLFAVSIIAVPLTASVTYAADEQHEAPLQAAAPSFAPSPAALPQGAAPHVRTAAAAVKPVRVAQADVVAPWEVSAATHDAEAAGWSAQQRAMEAHALAIQAQADAMQSVADTRMVEADAREAAAEATRVAQAAMAMAPRVEQSFSRDGKIQTLRVVTRGPDGTAMHTSTTVIDGTCPADRQRVARAVANGTVAETRVCVGAPETSAYATAALRQARLSIASTRHISDEHRREIQAELKAAEAEIAREMH